MATFTLGRSADHLRRGRQEDRGGQGQDQFLEAGGQRARGGCNRAALSRACGLGVPLKVPRIALGAALSRISSSFFCCSSLRAPRIFWSAIWRCGLTLGEALLVRQGVVLDDILRGGHADAGRMGFTFACRHAVRSSLVVQHFKLLFDRRQTRPAPRCLAQQRALLRERAKSEHPNTSALQRSHHCKDTGMSFHYRTSCLPGNTIRNEMMKRRQVEQ